EPVLVKGADVAALRQESARLRERHHPHRLEHRVAHDTYRLVDVTQGDLCEPADRPAPEEPFAVHADLAAVALVAGAEPFGHHDLVADRATGHRYKGRQCLANLQALLKVQVTIPDQQVQM